MESKKTGFQTIDEPSPWNLVDSGKLNGNVGIKELRDVIPAYCFEPSLPWSLFYLLRDLTYSTLLLITLFAVLGRPKVEESPVLYYTTVSLYGFCQGLVWTGLWIIGHDCGHSAFAKSSVINDSVGFVLHSALLAPYFSWKSTHRRHHIYANHIEKDVVYVPPQRDEYASRIGVAIDLLDEVGQDAPFVVFLRILLQQVIGWNWYLLTNITCGTEGVVRKQSSFWRHSHFDPWGSLFRKGELTSIILSDIGCLATIASLICLGFYLDSFEKVFWIYIVPWTWVNHWIVMITYLHHAHPDVPKYSSESWTFLRGATATIDRDFGWIGTHFFHHVTTDHVTHHLFSRIPHYYGPTASKAIIPLLGSHYHDKGTFTYDDLKLAFRECQWVEKDKSKDKRYGLDDDTEGKERTAALWYRSGFSPVPEWRMRGARVFPDKNVRGEEEEQKLVSIPALERVDQDQK